MASEPAEPATGSGDQTTGQPTAPEPPSQNKPTEPPSQNKPDTGDDKDWKAEAEKWQVQAKKHEKEWKRFSKELDDARQAQMSEQEKAVSEAEARGRAAAVTDVGQRLAAAEIKAALTGVVPDPAEIVEDLNLSRYVTDDGDVDLDAITGLRKKYEGFASKGDAPPAAGGQRPKENLRTVPLATGDAPKPDMNDWMRRKASS